jgi:serine/threonine-protein kinase
VGLPPEKTAAELDETQAYRSVDGELPQGEVRINLAPPGPSGEAQARYEEGPLLGRGGMGEVVLQLDRRIGRHVARKTLRADVPAARPRFLREARVQGQLEHPSVVPVYDLGVSPDGAPFFTMKRVRGQSLGQILEHLAGRDAGWAARFSRRKLLSAFVQVCLAVEYAHKRGVLHRDLKPENIMLGDFGEVYVLDWGLAKLVGEPADVADEGAVQEPIAPGIQVTRAGDILGTPRYMAPEQFGATRGALGPHSDVFGLGAILFEILTLSPYRAADSLSNLLLREVGRQAERPSTRAADVPPDLDDACVRALSLEPGDRGSALALAAALESYLEGDREQATREALARELLDAAAGNLARGDAGARVEAMRGALQALALTPDDAGAQKMLLSLVIDGSGSLPPAAEREFAEAHIPSRIEGMRFGLLGCLIWIVMFPSTLLLGVRDWTVLVLCLVLALASAVYLWTRLQASKRDPTKHYGHPIALALVIGLVISLNSAWLGPFILTPLNGSAAMVFFVFHSTRAERPWIIAILTLAVIAPFGVEFLHLFPPAYTFRGGDLVLHARSLALPEGPTTAMLAFGVCFLVVIGSFVGRIRDRKQQREREMFVQGWHLRQLFPRSSGETRGP